MNFTVLIICILLRVAVCEGLRVLGPSGPLTVQPGGSVMLPCYVDSPIPVEELEVEWRRTDSDTIVHLFQDGESRPESQDMEYHDRTRLFTEEVTHGNFSLLLVNVTVKDTGVYKCVIYRNQESNETLVEIKMSDYLIVSGGNVVSAYAREDTTLTCSVQSNIPPEQIEEVLWKKIKTDEDIVVLQFEKGHLEPESTHERYRDRVELFSPEEIHKGNFSLRLKNVQTDDKGLYICEVFHGDLSANTTVEVQQLGFSSMHTGVLFFCILAFGLPLLLGYTTYTSLKNNENKRSDLAVQCTLVCCPTISMALAFVFWGVTEGFLTETVTCSALNLLRIFHLFWVISHFRTFPENFQTYTKKYASLQGYVSIIAVIYSAFLVHNWHKYQALQNTAGRVWWVINWVVLSISLPWPFLFIICNKGWNIIQRIKIFYIVLICFCRTFTIVTNYGTKSIGNVGILLLLLLPLFWAICRMFIQFLLWTSVILIMEFLSAVLSIYLHNELMGTDTERVAMICVTTYLQVLSMGIVFEYFVHVKGKTSNARLQFNSRFNSNGTETQQSPGRLHVSVFMLGAVGLACVNSLLLITELILKTKNGERTITDLRVILLLSECVFGLGCLALQMLAFWRNQRKRLRKDLRYWQQLCRCTQAARNPPVENRELENLAPTSQQSNAEVHLE